MRLRYNQITTLVDEEHINDDSNDVEMQITNLHPEIS